MNLKELIESNINKFKKSTVFEEITENEFNIDFNNKLKINFTINEENKKLWIIIVEQDERYWNKNENLYWDNKYNFNTFNGYTIRTNNKPYINLDGSSNIDLRGYRSHIIDDSCGYNNDQEIIESILALEDWSINCPFFKEEVKEEEIKLNNNDSKYPIIDHSLNNNIAINSPDYNKYITDFLQQIQNIIKEKDDKIQELENSLLETNKTIDENKNRLKNIIIELIEGV